MFEVKLGDTGKVLTSVASKIVDSSSVKKVTEKKTSIFKSGKGDERFDTRPSISSLKKTETKVKTSLFKKADPKLKIRPFKSKVTFSDDFQRTAGGRTTDDGQRSDQQKATTTNYTIPEHKSTLTIHLDKYDLSASSPELNKSSTKGKFPYSRRKMSIDKTESEDRLMNIRMTTGSSTSVVTASELFSKLPIETLLQLGLPSNQSSQSSEQKLGAYSAADQRQRSSSFGKLSSSQTLDVVRKAEQKAIGLRLKNEIPETYLDKPKTSEANRRKSFQLQSSQTPIEMHSEYDINYQDTSFLSDSNDYWLRHRSLPNIQELVEDSGSENPSSPTSKDVNSKFTVTEVVSAEPDQKIKVNIRTGRQPVKELKEQLKEPAKRDQDHAPTKSIAELASKHNAQEKRTLYSKASKSSSGSNQSSSSLQRKCRKKIPVHLSSVKSNGVKQSSTDSDSSYYTAHSVHITIPETEPLGPFFQRISSDSISSANVQQAPGPISSVVVQMPQREALRRNFHTSNESTSSSANLSYHSASELFKSSSNTLHDSTQSLSTEAGTIPTIVVQMPQSPVISEQDVFFAQTDQEEQEDRRRRVLEHFYLSKKKSDSGDPKETEEKRD